MKNSRMIACLIALVVVLSLGLGLAVVNAMTRPDLLDGLPNYTHDKSKITVTGLNYEEQPYLGSPEAPVKVIEFADFKCPACKHWTAENFDTFKKEFIDTGKVQFFFMNYAFLDRDSYLAGIAGEAIYRQSNEKFWEFYKLIFENQKDEAEIWATPSFLIDLVGQQMKDIDMEQFKKDINNHTYLHQVKEDYKIGGYYGVNGTPTFFVNGILQRNSAYDSLQTAIREQLGE